jgi:hypothetical protein
MLRAVALDAQLYEEVEADKRSLGQATFVVLLACAAGMLGVWLRDVVLGGRSPGDGHVRLALAIDLVEPLVFWLGGSLFAYMVGVSIFRGPETKSDYLEVLRTTGFAFAPGLLRALTFAPPPGFGFAMAVVSDVWMLACGVVAVRQALDFTTLRALGTFGLAYAFLWLALTGILAGS